MLLLDHGDNCMSGGTCDVMDVLEELLADRRFPTPQRHLRQLYDDPFTGRPDWELVLGQAPMAVEPGASAPVASPCSADETCLDM